MVLRRAIVLSTLLVLLACQQSRANPEAALRTCMGKHARALWADERRRPSFDEAKKFARICVMIPKARRVSASEIDTLACAYSKQWNRCGRALPTD
jgi:hypothetical protein